MGGTVIIISVVLAYLLRQRCSPGARPTASGLLLLFLFVGLGAGRLPRRLHQDRQAAQPRPAQQGQDGRPVRWSAIIFGAAGAAVPRRPGRDAGLARSSPSPATGRAGRCRPSLVVLLILLMIAGASQRGEPHRRARRPGHRRLDDGLRRLHDHEHLAEQPVVRSSAPAPACYEVRDPLDLAVLAAALTGACFGFLWWNASPAKIFMGDTGSLALGGALAGFAIFTRTELLLVVLGGLFVAQTRVGDPAGRLLQAHRRQADVPDGAAAPPLRAEGLGRDHRRDPVLDHLPACASPPASGSSTPSGWPGHEPA